MSVRPSSLQVSPPKDWQQFERNMRDLFQAHWKSPAALHGRTGQPQHGVDIYGQPDGNQHYHGVQCKGHDGNLGAAVTERELKAEIHKATAFDPRLAHFILATTAPRDAKIQGLVRRLNGRKRKPFTVDVLFWDDIVTLYDQHPDVYDRHYTLPQLDRLHQLRPPLKDFTGRQEELTDLLANIGQGMTISSIQGMGGLGKTELAYVLAHCLKDAYPDAQLYLNLQGTSPQPLPSAEVLGFIIRCFAPEAKLPDDLAQLQSLYHSVLNGQRVLLFMDNAAGPAQIHSLGPPPAGSILLVTSRQHFTLSGLHARQLDTLPRDKARELLQAICPRVGNAADKVARLCGYLPMALRLAGSALACGTLEPADFAARLQDEHKRLSELDKGAKLAGEIALTASLALSEALLAEPLRRRWHMLAVFPGDFDVSATATVWETEHDDAQSALDALHCYSVVEWNSKTRRFRLHELVRLFAGEHLAPDQREAAQARHAEHYVLLLEQLGALYVKGAEPMLRALDSFDLESSNFQAGFEWARTRAADDLSAARMCVRYPSCGAWAFALRQSPRQRIDGAMEALRAAQRCGDRRAECALLSTLGMAHNTLGEFAAAVRYQRRALRISRAIDTRETQADILFRLADALVSQNRPRRAIRLCELAIGIAREMSDTAAEANALCNLARAHYRLGNIDKATQGWEKSLLVLSSVGDHRGMATVLNNLGAAYLRAGEPSDAIDRFSRASDLAKRIGDTRLQAATHANLGLAHTAFGQPRSAIKFFIRQYELARSKGLRQLEASAFGNLAEAYSALDDFRRALKLSQRQLRKARGIADVDAEADALARLSRVHFLVREAGPALDYAQQLMAHCATPAYRSTQSGLLTGAILDGEPKNSSLRQLVACWEDEIEAAHENGDVLGELSLLGMVFITQACAGDSARADAADQKLSAVLRTIGSPQFEIIQRLTLGDAFTANGQERRAIVQCERSIELSRSIQDRRLEAAGCWQLARVYERMENLPRAIELMQVRVDYEREIGDPDAEKHAAELAALRARLPNP